MSDGSLIYFIFVSGSRLPANARFVVAPGRAHSPGMLGKADQRRAWQSYCCEVAIRGPQGSGRSRANSDLHHPRFSEVFVVRLPRSVVDGLDIIETARGSLESHPNCCCKSSQVIECFFSLISQCNSAGLLSVAVEMPINP